MGDLEPIVDPSKDPAVNETTAPVDDSLDFDDPSTGPDPGNVGETVTDNAGAPPHGDPAPIPDADDAGDAGDDSEFPQELLDAAGIDAERATAQFGSAEALANAITMMDQRFVQAARNLAPTPPDESADDEGEPGDVDADEGTATTTSDESGPLGWLPSPSDGEDWDDDTKRLVAAMDERYRKELAARDRELEEQREFLAAIASERVQEEELRAQQQAAQYVQEFDEFIDALGDDFSPVFGSGPGAQMDPNSMQFQNRIQLDQVAAQLAAGRAAYGQPELPRDELLVRAVRVAFPEVLTRQVEDTVAQRQDEFTTRPTQRSSGGELPPGEQRAIAGLREWYAARGITTMDDEDDYEI